MHKIQTGFEKTSSNILGTEQYSRPNPYIADEGLRVPEAGGMDLKRCY